MNSVFRQHQLLRCQTIGQCLILDADVREECKSRAYKGEEVGKHVAQSKVKINRLFM